MPSKWRGSAIEFSSLSVIPGFFGRLAALSFASGTIHSHGSLDEPSGATSQGGRSWPGTSTAVGGPCPVCSPPSADSEAPSHFQELCRQAFPTPSSGPQLHTVKATQTWALSLNRGFVTEVGILVGAEKSGTAFTEISCGSHAAALSAHPGLDASCVFIHQHLSLWLAAFGLRIFFYQKHDWVIRL